MNLHLFNDEKVVDRTISYFEEALPGKNKFIVLVPTRNYKPKYVKSTHRVHLVKYGTKDFWETVGNVAEYSSIFLHSLSFLRAKFVCSITHPNIIWVVWGGDLYSTFLERKGYKIYSDTRYINKFGCKGFRKFISPFISLLKNIEFKTYSNALKKISCFAGMYTDYELFTHTFPEYQNLTFVDFFYYPLDDIAENRYKQTKFNGDVMIGNSGSFSGNHLEVLSFLRSINLRDVNVYASLSYGNTKYIEYVLSVGKDVFKENFKPLISFIPLREYNAILANCDNFIYGHYRQEAMGNILIALCLGKKVFLHKRNPVLKYFLDIGVKIYTIEQFEKEYSTPMEIGTKSTNLKILLNKYNKSRLLKIIQSMFSYDAIK